MESFFIKRIGKYNVCALHKIQGEISLIAHFIVSYVFFRRILRLKIVIAYFSKNIFLFKHGQDHWPRSMSKIIQSGKNP